MKILRRKLSLFLICLTWAGFALAATDSTIFDIIKQVNTPEAKAAYLTNYIDTCGTTKIIDNESIILLADSIIQKNQLDKYFGIISYQKGDLHFQKGDYKKSIIELIKAEAEFSEKKQAKKLAKTYNKLGVVYISQADFPLALDYFIKSLNIKDSIGDTKGISNTYSNMGNALFEMDDTDRALEYYLKSLAIDKADSNEVGMAKTLMNVGVVYKEQFKYNKAVECFEKSLNMHLAHHNMQEVANCYSNLALVYLETGDDQKTLSYYNKALKLFEQLGIKKGISSVLSDIGFFYNLKGDDTRALDYLKKAIRLAQEINSVQDIERISQAISASYQNLGNYKEAFNYFVLYKSMYDKLNNDENTRLFTKMEMNYQFEQTKKEIEFEQQQKELKHLAEIKRQQLILKFIIIGALALLVFAIYFYRNYKQKKRDNELLKKQKKAIEEQRDKINKQKKDITDSILYAKRIQTALLPPNTLLDNLLSDYFVLYKPRDIVSGDYYWVSNKNEKTVIVAADCTGHGVPGAFMSMLGMAFLNEIIQQENDILSDALLNKLRENVIVSLRQTGKIGETKDGMDLAMTIVDRKNQRLQFSGANNPLVLIRNGEILQYKGDKMPIGISDKANSSFTSHVIDFKPGDTFYMYSDGYVDQFGGPDNRKFMSKSFREMLLNIQDKTMKDQETYLNETIDNWRGSTEQIDDILVMGIKL